MTAPTVDDVLRLWSERRKQPATAEDAAPAARLLDNAVRVGRAQGIRPEVLFGYWIDAYLGEPHEPADLGEVVRDVPRFGSPRHLPFGGREAVLVKLSHGTQLAVKVRPEPTGGDGSALFTVWAWRNNSYEWTNPKKVRVDKVIGPADTNERRFRAAAERWLPDGSGPVPRRRPAG